MLSARVSASWSLLSRYVKFKKGGTFLLYNLREIVRLWS